MNTHVAFPGAPGASVWETPREAVERFLATPLPPDFVFPVGTHLKEVDFLGMAELQALMLERPPFYFIERAVVVNSTTVWGVADMSLERSAGHFPGRPIVPLIELCKAIAQTGIIIAALQGDTTQAPIAIRAGKSRALTRELVDAPARIAIRTELTQVRHGLMFVSGTTYLQGKPIGSLEDTTYILVDRRTLLKAT